MICASNFNRNHYITIITISFLAVFVVLAKVLLIDYQPPIVGKSDLNLKNHYYQGTVEKVKGSCSCKNLVSDDGRGNCKGTKIAKQGKIRAICYVNQPSYCGDLEDSIKIPGEQHSAEACLSEESGCLHCYDHRFGKECKKDTNDNSICVTLDEIYYCSNVNSSYEGPCRNWGIVLSTTNDATTNNDKIPATNSEQREPKAVEPVDWDYTCEMKDSDECLQESPSWSNSYTCATSKGYCKRWSKDMKRCCPKTCENTKPFSEYECRVAKGKGTCTYPNEAQCLNKVPLQVGDVVRMSNFKSVVEKSFEGTPYAWSDQMRSMLGKDFTVLEIREDGIIGLPSPNGQQNGKWFFHQRAVRKIEGKPETQSTTEQSKIVSTEPESIDEPIVDSEQNTPSDVGALPGPPGNAIDIDPDGLSELTFGQLLVLFSKIDKAKKEAAAAGNANPVTISPGTTAVKKQPGNLTTSRKKQPGSLPTARKNPPGSFPSTRCSCDHCYDNRYNRQCKRDSKKMKNCVTYNEIYLCSKLSMTYVGPCECKESPDTKNSFGRTDIKQPKKKITKLGGSVITSRPATTKASKTKKNYFSTTFDTSKYFENNKKPSRIPVTPRTKATLRTTTKKYFTTTSQTRNFKKNKGNLPPTRPRANPNVPISTRTTGKTATTKSDFSTTFDTSKYFNDKGNKKTTKRPQKAVRVPVTTRTRGTIRTTTKNYFTTTFKTIQFKKNNANTTPRASKTKPSLPTISRTTVPTVKVTKKYFSTTVKTNHFRKNNTKVLLRSQTTRTLSSPTTEYTPITRSSTTSTTTTITTTTITTTTSTTTTTITSITIKSSVTSHRTKYVSKTNFRDFYKKSTTTLPSTSVSTRVSTLINKASSDIKPTVKILSDNHDRTRPEIFSNARVPVLRMRPIEQTKVNDETRNASNTEKSNLAESTVTKMKIDGPKDPFAKHSTGYHFYGGCLDGKSCSNGKICGTATACRRCSLEDCQLLAESRGSFAFSYRGTSHRWCRMCDQSSFANHVSDHDWAIYTKHDFKSKECFNIGLTTKVSANEISWELGGCKNYVDNKGYENNQFYQQICCLAPGRYQMRCRNILREGWNGAFADINGQKCCEHFLSGKEQKCDVTISTGRNDLGFKGLNDPILCDTLQDGLYSDPDNCSKMFWCSNGHLSRLTCPAGLLFDTTLGVCNFFMESNRCVLGTVKRVSSIDRETSLPFQFAVSPYQSLPT